jgi:hypothetical protein
MKFWWLKLYTIPNIKEQMVLTICFILTHLCLYYFLPDYLLISIFSLAAVLIVPSLPRAKSFKNNLSFHEMTVPRKLLRRYFLADFVIHILAKGVLLSICVLIISYFQLDKSQADSETGIPVISSFILALVPFVSYIFVLRNWENSVKLDLSSLLQVVGYAGVTLIVFVLLNKISMSYELSLYFIFTAIGVGIALLYFRYFFHQEISIESSLTSSKYVGVGAVLTLTLMICMNIVYRTLEINSPYHSVSSIADDYVFWGNFNSKLTKDQFLKFVKSEYSEKIIYQKAPDGYEIISLNDLFDDPSEFKYRYYLKYAKVNDQNFMLLGNSVSELEKSYSISQGFKKQLAEMWPSHLKKPQFLVQYLDLKHKNERSIASEKRLKNKYKILDQH